MTHWLTIWRSEKVWLTHWVTTSDQEMLAHLKRKPETAYCTPIMFWGALRLSFNLVLLYSRNFLKLFRPFMAIFSLSEEWKTKVFHLAWRNQTCGADANEGFDREDVNFNDASSHRLGSSVLSVLRTAEQCSECSGVLLYSKRWWCLAVMTAIKSHQSRASYPC